MSDVAATGEYWAKAEREFALWLAETGVAFYRIDNDRGYSYSPEMWDDNMKRSDYVFKLGTNTPSFSVDVKVHATHRQQDGSWVIYIPVREVRLSVAFGKHFEMASIFAIRNNILGPYGGLAEMNDKPSWFFVGAEALGQSEEHMYDMSNGGGKPESCHQYRIRRDATTVVSDRESMLKRLGNITFGRFRV